VKTARKWLFAFGLGVVAGVGASVYHWKGVLNGEEAAHRATVRAYEKALAEQRNFYNDLMAKGGGK
jgi:hypothetical protein